jgi:hypothetical protein
MLQFFKHLNNGYDPMLILGRGALGYRPPRQMIGRRVPQRYRPFRAIFGRGGGDEEDEEDEEVGHGGGGGGPSESSRYGDEEDDPTETVTKYQPTYAPAFMESIQKTKSLNDLITYIPQIDEYFMSGKINLDESEDLLSMLNAKKTDLAQYEERKEMVSRANKLLEKFNKSLTSSKQSKIVDQSKISKLFENSLQLLDKIKDNNTETITRITNELKKHIESRKESKADPQAHYYKTELAKAYIKSINDTISIILKINNFAEISIIKNAHNDITLWLSDLNEINNNNQYQLENGNLIKIEKEPTVKGKFDKNLSIDKAKKLIQNYWDTNNKSELTTNKSYNKYDKEINQIINQINDFIDNNGLIDQKYTSKDDKSFKKAIEFGDKFPDIDLAYSYMDTITVHGEKKLKTMDQKYKEYSSDGKSAEFSICGVNNPLAHKIYGIPTPDMQVSDFIVENILGSGIGKQFCIDNIDTTNKIFSEMKDYAKCSTFMSSYLLNIELKKLYINDLKVELNNLFEKYIIEKDLEKKATMKENIKIYRDTLTDIKLFEKDFYTNRNYIGIGVTMNKFNPIVVPDGYDYSDGPNTKEHIEFVKSRQGQKFAPHMTDRKITHVTYEIKTKPDNVSKFNTEFNELIDVPYSYVITCTFDQGKKYGKKVIGVYNYTLDDLVKNDFILGTYKCGFAEDDRYKIYINSVIIPIEKFILRK